MKKILYLGLDPSRFIHQGELIHYPIIRIVPRPLEELHTLFLSFHTYTHLLCTSRTAATLFLKHMSTYGLSMADLYAKRILVVGKATAQVFDRVDAIAQEETGEGVIKLLQQEKTLKQGHLFFPHSALSRNIIMDYLNTQGIRTTASVFYDTIPNSQEPLPRLDMFDEIIFTSPSTVDAFLHIFKAFPKQVTLTPIGPITQKTLDNILNMSYLANDKEN